MLRRISSRLSAVTSSLNGSLREVAAVERNQQPAHEAADPNPARAFVRRHAVGVALRVVELLLAGLHVDVGVGHLAEVDLRPGHGQARRRALRPACCFSSSRGRPSGVKPLTAFMVMP